MSKNTNKSFDKKINDDAFDLYFSPQKKQIKQYSMIDKSKESLYEDLFLIPCKSQYPDHKLKINQYGLTQKKQLLNERTNLLTAIKVNPVNKNNQKQQLKVVHSRIPRSYSSSHLKSTNSNMNRSNLHKTNSINQKTNNCNIQIVPCQKIQNDQFLQHEKVKMYKHEIVTKSFFSIGYVLYHIEVFPSNKLIKRNHDDFQRLRNILEKQFPATRIPYLQASNWLYQTSLQSVKKQKIMLEYFLNDLLGRKQFRNSKILNQFLSKQQHKDIKKSFVSHEKNNGIRCIQQIKNQTGCVQLDFKALEQQNFQTIAAFYKHMHTSFNDLHSQVETFTIHQTNLAKSMANITDIFTRINTKIDKYNQDLQIKDYKLANAPNLLQNLHDSFKKIEHKFTVTKDALQGDFLSFLNYEKSNIETLDPLINTISLFSKAYGRRIAHDDAARIENQSNNSLKLYLSEKKAIFKSHLMQESKDNIVFKYQIGFLKQQMLCQIQTYFEHLFSNLKKKYQDLQLFQKLTEIPKQSKQIKLLFQ